MRAPNAGTIDLVCPVCDRKFWRYASQAQWRGAKYCSNRCKNTGRTTAQRLTCKQCRKRFTRQANVVADPRRAKFCGRACYEKWIEAHTKKVKRKCVVCGKTFEVFPAWLRKNGGRSCSVGCASIAKRRGPTLPRRGAAWRRLAESIRERDGHRCVRCGEPELSTQKNKSKPNALSVDHILAARLFVDDPSLADNPLNLASLCNSCHGVKTNRYEPRILRGDFLAIEEFYDRETRLRVMALLP